ncbi:MAG: hypothetical protein CVU90_07070 [Firmicutes bacterium HGW-Firmicutes-15]|nr:MAG: hypothetical protein CVU90_07070 [Firmicutes bacterium HGW-Firmicutes-15]
MEITLGKKLDSYALNRDLDKHQSIKICADVSTKVKPGKVLTRCPLCDSDRINYLQTIYNFDYSECNNCRVAFVSNPPEDIDIENLYKSDSYTRNNNKLFSSDSTIDFRIKNISKPKVEYLLKRLHTPKKSWLDIGCGIGEVLYVLSMIGNWNTLGVETNDFERIYGNEHFGLNIIDKYVNADNIKDFDKKFGVISLFGVLEHIKNPNELISQISLIQETNDNLILEVPNYPSLSVYSQLTFPEYVNRGMHPPLHLFLFSLNSLELMMEKFGYKITHAWYFGQDFYEIWSTLALFTNNKLNNSLLHNNVSLLINDFQQVIDNQRLSDEIIIIAKKM